MLKTLRKLPKIGEVIHYYPNEDDDFVLAYVLDYYNDVIYLYVQNRIMAIKIARTIEEDLLTGDLYNDVYEVHTREICDYCIIPEADYILKRD